MSMYDEDGIEYADDPYEEGYLEGQKAQLNKLTDEEIITLIDNARRERIVAQLNPHNNYGTEYMDEDGEFRMDFADPGGNSALRAASKNNPRILPCPNCHRENMLTPADRAKKYICDGCADARERGGWGYGEY